MSLSRVERALLEMRNRRSTWQFVAIITLASVVMSVAITMLIAVATNMNNEYMVDAFVSSIIVPMLVAPVVSYESARIMGALDRAVSELEQVAHVDALTGESNRRHFFSCGSEIISRDALAASASVGLIDASGLDLDEALRRADAALYASKSSSIRETDRSQTEGRVTERRVTEAS